MLGTVSCRIATHLMRGALTGIIVLICSGLFHNKAFSSTSIVYAMDTRGYNTENSCPLAAFPSRQSLLLVLLDRSGSLTAEPGATDPKGYSTSVTKVLADLWPGKMAVIPFSNDQTPILGPANLSDPVQQADLKSKVENYPIGGDTPLGPAVHQALDLLKQNQMPAGSRVIVITDGNPTGSGNDDGPHQEQDIRNNLLPQFCRAGLPFSAFGLTIDPNTADGQDANKLLSDIAAGTGASYTNVKGPEDLAREVISLYAQWQGLTFTQIQPSQGDNYPVSIDTFANQISIVSFRSDSTYNITLIGPDKRPVTQGIQRATDRHYEIDSFNVSGPLIAGTYIVNAGGDPNTQVYALVNSPLKIQLVQPTATTVAFTNQSVQLQAQFINDSGPVTPEAGAAQVIARVTLLANGRPVGPATNTVVLTQQKTSLGSLTPIFSGGTIVYRQPGELRIDVVGTYQQAQRQTSFTLPLKLAPRLGASPPPSVPWNLIIVGLGILLALALIAVLVLAFIHWQQAQPRPYGYITNGKRNGDVALEAFSRLVISSQDIQVRGVFNFSANFELVFTKEGIVKIRAQAPGVMVEVPGKPRPEEVTPTGVELKASRKIYTNGRKVASFETAPGRLWT